MGRPAEAGHETTHLLRLRPWAVGHNVRFKDRPVGGVAVHRLIAARPSTVGRVIRNSARSFSLAPWLRLG